MPAVDRAELARRQRERKQKILLVFMLLLLVIMVVWQGPRTLKRLKGEPAAAPAVQTTTGAASTTPSPSTGVSTTGGGTTAPGVQADPQAALAAERNLGDTDIPPTADQDQLISFSRFEARDPFVQLVSGESSASTAPEDGGSSSGGSSAPPPTSGGSSGSSFYPPPTASGGGTVTTGEVKLSVNGKVETHKVGESFPASDPAFQIVAVNGDSVQIGLVSGQFSGGQQTITVSVGDEVTLVSQPDGARYTIKIISVS
jgi:hypothetical protein